VISRDILHLLTQFYLTGVLYAKYILTKGIKLWGLVYSVANWECWHVFNSNDFWVQAEKIFIGRCELLVGSVYSKIHPINNIIGILRIRTSDRDKSVQASNRDSKVGTQVEYIITWGQARRFSCWLWPPACTCSSPWPSGSWRRPARLPSRPSCAEGSSHAIRTRTRRASVPTNSTVDWRFDGNRNNTIPR